MARLKAEEEAQEREREREREEAQYGTLTHKRQKNLCNYYFTALFH
jgi:hypothetical protein